MKILSSLSHAAHAAYNGLKSFASGIASRAKSAFSRAGSFVSALYTAVAKKICAQKTPANTEEVATTSAVSSSVLNRSNSAENLNELDSE